MRSPRWTATAGGRTTTTSATITRRDPAASPGPAWLPEHTVDLDLLLAAYTIQGAFAAFQEKATGSIEVGKRADLIVLDKDLTQVPAHEIAGVKVLRTFVEGARTF